jgi:predicted nucleotide-binding protein
VNALEPLNQPSEVFISYSHQDSAWLDKLRVHLKPLEYEYGIDIWDDTKIKPGSKWQEKIERALKSAKVALLLVSANFLASDFIRNEELPKLLTVAEKKGTTILMIIVGPCLFERTKSLSRFQALNAPSKPLAAMKPFERDIVFVKAADSIAELLSPERTMKTKDRVTSKCEISEQNTKPSLAIKTSRQSPGECLDSKIIIVNGRDNAMKETVARTIEKLGLIPLILHDKLDRSKSISDLSSLSEGSYAIILLSPDEVNYPIIGKAEKTLRARQNVILEMGYFLGKLGRDRVAVIYKAVESFELPSDLTGVAYMQFDDEGKWWFNIAKALQASGYPVALDKLTSIY